MSTYSSNLPRLASGEPDIDIWLDQASQLSLTARQQAIAVFELLDDTKSREHGIALVELLLELKMDSATVIAGMAVFAVERGELEPQQLPNDAAALVAAVLPLAAANVLAFNDSSVLAGGAQRQVENVRGMLLALIDDPRVAVIKLAERVVALRDAKHRNDNGRWVIAQQAMQFYAPLAGRLGIWSLKWNLEDLAFSVLHPNEYRDVAEKLDSRRDERERQVEAMRQDLEFRLSAVDIEADVQGRAKHIYSIWRKMSAKSLDFAEVRDVHAVRVLVNSVEEVYLTLGVVHTSWPPIPGELDDYVATPKENGYQSIHTAVIGPMGVTLEVQIRTHEMHEESELGVCAHWAYKGDEQRDGANAGPDGGRSAAGAAGPAGIAARRPAPEAAGLASGKAEWLRAILEWHEDIGSTTGAGFDQDRIFVTTPGGHVLDMPPSATPIDFAYRVHTEVGHRCRGAKVNGREVPLNRRLATGECIEIETGDEEAPKREWLNPALGFIGTARARSKIQGWYRKQLAETNSEAGRALLERTLDRLGLAPRVDELAHRAGYSSTEDMLVAVGVGEQLVVDLVPLLAPGRHLGQGTRVPTAIAGSDTAGFDNGAANGDADAAWPGPIHSLVVEGNDRAGLLRDVMTVVAAQSISIVAATAQTDPATRTAYIDMDMHAPELAALALAIEGIQRIPDVLDIRRHGTSETG